MRYHTLKQETLAVQNMNLMFGFKETEGLELVPMFP